MIDGIRILFRRIEWLKKRKYMVGLMPKKKEENLDGSS